MLAYYGINEDAGYGETLRQLCNAITEYLGVSEVIDSLDPRLGVSTPWKALDGRSCRWTGLY